MVMNHNFPLAKYFFEPQEVKCFSQRHSLIQLSYEMHSYIKQVAHFLVYIYFSSDMNVCWHV